jgi:ribosomal protein S18 acetylase RimI-like enzyme
LTFEHVAENLRESFRAVAGSRQAGEVRELAGVSIASAGAAFQMFNAAFLSEPVHGEDELARRILLASLHFDARGLEWACWACHGWLDSRARRRSREIFSRHGLRHSTDLPGMVAENMEPPFRPLPVLDIRPVGDQRTRDAFCAIGSVCFHVPIVWFRQVFDSDTVWQRFAGYVAYLDGAPVATTATVVGGGVVGVYNVGTLPDLRGRGYAEAVMRHALSEARRRHGIERSVLQSTPAGLRLYERMGYRAVTSIAVYSS